MAPSSKRLARRLLREHLTRRQFLSYKFRRKFIVKGADGYRYRLLRRRQHNVRKLKPRSWRTMRRYCLIVTSPRVPLDDQVVIIKTMLESPDGIKTFHTTAF